MVTSLKDSEPKRKMPLVTVRGWLPFRTAFGIYNSLDAAAATYSMVEPNG